MEVAAAAYSNSSSSYSSSSSSSSLQEARGLRSVAEQPANFHASLHSVRKPMAKPWKKPIAPLPPTPPRVYKVDPVNFRDLVQKLTGAPEFMSPQSHHSSSSATLQQQLIQLPHRLHRVAPPPLSLAAPSPLSRAQVSSPIMHHHNNNNNNNLIMNTTTTPSSPSFGMLNLSPSSYNWCSFPILSPGTLSSLEQSTVP